MEKTASVLALRGYNLKMEAPGRPETPSRMYTVQTASLLQERDIS
jgi:hypothetical protein